MLLYFSRVQILHSHTDVIVVRTNTHHPAILISQTATHSERPPYGIDTNSDNDIVSFGITTLTNKSQIECALAATEEEAR